MRRKYLIISLLCLIYHVLSASVPVEKTEDFLADPKYQTYDQMYTLFRTLEEQNPEIVKLHSIGKSIENRDLLAVEISYPVQTRKVLKPMFKYVANMHGDEVVGYQLLIYLAQYLISNYKTQSRVTELINNTDIFLMPSMNPDGLSASKVSTSHRPFPSI